MLQPPEGVNADGTQRQESRRCLAQGDFHQSFDSPKAQASGANREVNDETYVRLCTLKATQRRTNQDILREALREYLERVAG
jgi:hypothetical protein